MRHSLFRLVLGSALAIGAGSVAEAAMSVKDFMRPAAATPAEGAAAGLGSSMTLQGFLRLSEQKDDLGLVRYFDGFRDALYQFNSVLQGVGVQVCR